MLEGNEERARQQNKKEEPWSQMQKQHASLSVVVLDITDGERLHTKIDRARLTVAVPTLRGPHLRRCLNVLWECEAPVCDERAQEGTL